MYMEELTKHLRREAGEEDDPRDTPISGDITDSDDLGVKLEVVN